MKTTFTHVDPHACPTELKNLMNDDAAHEMDIFTQAIKLALKDRSTFLDIACHNDEQVRRRVEALLCAHDRLGNFLEKSPVRELSKKTKRAPTPYRD